MSNKYDPTVCNCDGSGYQRWEDDEGYVHAGICLCLIEKNKRDVTERLLRLCGVPAKYRRCTLENFNVTRKNTAAFEAVKVFVEGTGLPSVAIIGVPNNGKTHLLTAAIMEMVQRGEHAVYVSIAELLAQMRMGMEPGLPFSDTTEAIVDRYKKVDVLALDDWGANHATDWASARFDEIISYRDAEEKRTIVASNMLEKEFPERARSRLAGRGWSHFVINAEAPYV